MRQECEASESPENAELLVAMLQWRGSDRLSAAEALAHAFFRTGVVAAAPQGIAAGSAAVRECHEFACDAALSVRCGGAAREEAAEDVEQEAEAHDGAAPCRDLRKIRFPSKSALNRNVAPAVNLVVR